MANNRKTKKALWNNSIITPYFYSLFAINTIKSSNLISIDGIKINNLVLLLPIYIIIKSIIYKIKKINFKVAFLLIIYTIFLIIHSLFLNHNAQSFYSVAIILLPMALILLINIKCGKAFIVSLKAIILLGLLYSIVVIIKSLFYNEMSQIFNISSSITASTRQSTIIGSSITTSYYLLMNIPLCMIGIKEIVSKKWKNVSLITLILSAFAIILLRSRICFIILGIYAAIYLLILGKKIKISYRILSVSLIAILLIGILNNEQFSRLYTDYSTSKSTETRLEIFETGVNEFYKNPLLGSGIANYYKRLWNKKSRNIIIEDTVSITDPHNLYLYILVEQGIIGLLIFFSIFVVLFKEYIRYLPKNIKQNIYILVTAQCIAQTCGSQLINEINYATILWSYITIICSRGYYERLKSETI